jgi:uncharacterized protein (UPF0371 family)
MSAQIGFDNEKYLEQQSGEILSRVARFNHKLYLEFGGKILFDYHAARVLPGFDPNVKMRLLQRLKDDIDVILCIFAGDIERKKLRADFGITYDTDSLKTIDDFKQWGVEITAVVITRYADQPSAKAFKNKLERRGIRVFTHSFTKGYPTDVDLIVSDAGYGSNAYIPTTKPIVIVTGPGPGSGKLATCLGQLYHEYKRGVQAGYAKFETFPIWNLPLNHNVNAAYEAATVDLKDFNLIDPHHLESYGKTAVNYNRDVEAFPLLRKILEKITGTKSFYQSPTDMGVNRAGFGIIDDSIVQKAAHQEIIRRYFRCACEYALGYVEKDILERAEMIMKRVDGSEQARPVIALAREAAVEAMEKGKGNDGIYCGAAVELADGTLLTGKNSSLMHAASSLTLNAIKHLAGLPDNLHLIPENVISALAVLKKNILQGKGISLDVEETLIALTISAISNPAAELATGFLKELRGCEVHLTHIPTPGDEAGLRKLGVHLTSDPEFSSKSLFIN